MNFNPKKCSFGVEEGPFLGHLITKQGIRANPSKVKAITDVEQLKTLKDVQSLNGKIAALSRFLSKDAKRSLRFFKVLKRCTDKKNIQWKQEAEAALQEMKKFMEILPTLTAPVQGEVLMMYIKTSTESISASLFAKREKEQVPIYFVSRVKQGDELNYPGMEKLILALVHAARRLRRSDETPKDFLIKVPLEDNKKEEVEKADTKPTKTELSCEWKLFTDGAASSNGFGVGLMLIDLEGKEYTYALSFEFKTINNKAEYEALLAGLRISQEMEITSLAIFVDSQLLDFDSYMIEQIQRNQNKKSDALSKLASMTFEHLTKEVMVEVLPKWSIEEKEILQEDQVKAPQYKLIRRNMYRRSFYTPWLRCVASPQTDDIVKEVHEDLYKGLKVTQSFSPITEHMEIINHIEKQLAQSQQGWVDDLSQVLWVHITLLRNSQKETPFSLTYSSEAIILIFENDVAKDDKGRIKEVDKRRGSKEIASIEEAYYRSKLRRHH
ncbi:reverse transcriptase domain-containing protein [Tanacetum coccineum]